MPRSEAISFSAWRDGPIVVAQIAGETLTPLVYGFRGNVYSVTGSVLQRNAKVDDVAASLGVQPRRVTTFKETNRFRALVNEKDLRNLLDIRSTPHKASTPRAINPEVAAKKAEEEGLRQFLSAKSLTFTTVQGRDPRLPADAIKHAKAADLRVMFVIEFPDSRGKKATVIGAAPGFFWPGVPGREEGMGAGSRNRCAANQITTLFGAYKNSSQTQGAA